MEARLVEDYGVDGIVCLSLYVSILIYILKHRPICGS